MTSTSKGFSYQLDLATLQAASLGKAWAQRDIFERFKPMVLRTLIGLCHDNELARDLAQDVFIQVFKSLHQLEQAEAFSGWLKKLTINLALAHFRKHKQHFESLDDSEIVNHDWLSKADWLVQLDQIDSLISQLNDQERLIVWLFLGEDYSHEEIAELLKQKPATVRQRYHRALKKLHHFLTKEGR